MADVELFDLWDGRYGLHVLIRQPMPRVDGEADLLRVRSGAAQFVQCGVATPPRVGVATSMDFDRGHAE